MLVFVLHLFSGLAFVGFIWMVSGETSLSSSASSGRKTVRRRHRREIMLSQDDRISFLQTHNKYRNDVGKDTDRKIPTAAKMMRMYWSAHLEASSISRSKKCHVGKKNITSEVVRLTEFTKALSQYGNTTGYSYFAAAYKPSPFEVLEYFANESQGFSYSKRRGGICTGRALCLTYTQLVSESSFLVGCGFAQCDNFYVTTCHYLPAGNLEGMKVPFKDGDSCSLCGSSGTYDFTECEEQLCVPQELCSPVKECTVVDTENCLCSNEEYEKIVRRMLKDVSVIHAGPPVIVYGLLLPLVAILLSQRVQLGYDDPGLQQQL